MSRSICRFMPAKDAGEPVKTVNFVFETELSRLRQPFFAHVNVLNLVVRGAGQLKLGDKWIPLERGSLFMIPAGEFYELRGNGDFDYLYISFTGDPLPGDLSREGAAPVRNGFGHLTDFWLNALRRLEPANANLLTESVLLYTLSYLAGGSGTVSDPVKRPDSFRAMREYVERNYTDPELSLKKIAVLFCYSPKYASALFRRHLDTGFNDYVNRLRIRLALSLIREGEQSVSRLAERCGFSDPMYFSNVFKKRVGTAPSVMIKRENDRGSSGDPAIQSNE